MSVPTSSITCYLSSSHPHQHRSDLIYFLPSKSRPPWGSSLCPARVSSCLRSLRVVSRLRPTIKTSHMSRAWVFVLMQSVLYLSWDARVIESRNPQHVFASHPVPSNQRILVLFVLSVSMVVCLDGCWSLMLMLMMGLLWWWIFASLLERIAWARGRCAANRWRSVEGSPLKTSCWSQGCCLQTTAWSNLFLWWFDLCNRRRRYGRWDYVSHTLGLPPLVPALLHSNGIVWVRHRQLDSLLVDRRRWEIHPSVPSDPILSSRDPLQLRKLGGEPIDSTAQRKSRGERRDTIGTSSTRQQRKQHSFR